jgi:C-terminal processing protease CtpA/Prc
VRSSIDLSGAKSACRRSPCPFHDAHASGSDDHRRDSSIDDSADSADKKSAGKTLKLHRLSISWLVIGALTACGGGGGGGGGSGTSAPPVTTTPAPPSGTGCSLRERQDWAFSVLNEWYLFPETLPTNPNPSAFATVSDYIDSLTSVARAQGRDRFFTFLTSIAEENAFFSSGATAGFGIRLSIDIPAQRLFVAEAFEGAPALAAGIDRGTEILAIGTSSADLRTVSSIIAAEGSAGINNAIGPSTAGITRLLRITDANGTRDVSVTKAAFDIPPVSPRYGVQVINDGGRRVGYVNLRTFIDTADPALRNAFAQFRSQGITDIVIDLRYNGGGLVSIAELIGDLLGANRSTSDVFSFTTFRPSKSANDQTRFFRPQVQSLAPTRIAFIGTGSTASASELVINSFIPYLHTNLALVGTNTFGKPVGQIAVDRAQCDDRLRVVAFATQNRLRQGDYFTGLATRVEASCQASDDIFHPMGDPLETSTARAIDFLAGRSCTAISAAPGQAPRAQAPAARELLAPPRPSSVQREVPGLF